MEEGHESDHDSTLVLDIDQELSALKQESADLASLLDQSSPESHIISSPKNFIARNITAIKSLKRKEPKVTIDPVASPIRIPKQISEDSHLLRLTQATRDKIVRPDVKRSGSSRSQTPQPGVTIRKVKRANSSVEGKSDRSVSAPRMRLCEDPVQQMYATPSFQAPVSDAETSLDNPPIVPRLKRSPDLSQVPDSQLEKLVSTESFERSLPMIMSQARRIEPEPSFPDPFSDETISSRKIGIVFDRVQHRKDREHDTNLSIYRVMDQVVEVVLTDESGSEGPEEIWRYLQHWFTLYYTDFRRQTLQELLGLLILRGNYKRAQNPVVTGISLSERVRKRSRQGVVTFKEMEKRLDEVLSKGRATITRTASLIDSRSSTQGHFQEKIVQFLSAGTTQPVQTLEDPIDLLQPAQIISTALETTATPADLLLPDILLNLVAPKMKLMERRHLSLSLETLEIRTKLAHATTGISSLTEKASLVPKLIVLKQFEEAKEAAEDVRLGLSAMKSKGNDTITGLRREMTLWSAWILLLRHTSGVSIDRSVLGGAMEQLQKHTMPSRCLETLRKICLIYLFYHTCLWRSEDRALSHLRSIGLGEWEVVLEADLKLRTEDPLTEAAAAESLLLHLDAAPTLRFIMFMRLARHYKAYELHEKIVSAGKKVLLVHPPLCREHSVLVLSTMLKSQGVLDPAAVLSYQVMMDKSDFSILYQYARVSIKSKTNGTAVTARNALEMLLAYAQDYTHLRKFLFQFQVHSTQFWKFLLYKVNCFHRTATHLGSNLLTMTADNSVQKRSVEKFLNEMKEVKTCLHEVYDKCKRKDIQSGKWVEDTVRKVERLDPYLGLCLFIALEKPATLGVYTQILRDYPNRFESYFVNWIRLYRLNKVREKQLKQIEGQEEVDKRDSNHPLSLLPQLKERLDNVKLMYQDCLTVRLQCLWQMYGKWYGPMRLSDAYRIIQAKSYLRTNYQKSITKLKKATHSGRAAASIVYYLLAKYMLELERHESHGSYKELKVYLNSFGLQKDMDERYLAKALCLHAEVEAGAGHYECVIYREALKLYDVANEECLKLGLRDFLAKRSVTKEFLQQRCHKSTDAQNRCAELSLTPDSSNRTKFCLCASAFLSTSHETVAIMFNKVLENLGKKPDTANSSFVDSPSKTKSKFPNAKDVPVPVSDTSLQAGMEFGTNLLISNGLLSPKIMIKLQKHRPNPEVIRITTALDLKNLQLARDLALDRNFIESNEIFVNSGQAVKTAIEKGFMEFAWELVKNGYKLPDSLIVEGIQSDHKQLVSNVIEGGFYTKEDCVELDFWYLLHQGMMDEAKKLFAREPIVQRFRGGLDNPEEVKRLLVDEELATAALRIALTHGHDSIASIILSIIPSIIQKEMIPLALEKCCIAFLKKVWTGHFHLKEGDQIRSRKKTSVLWEALEKTIESREDLKQLVGNLKLSYIIDKLLDKKRVMEAANVLTWPGAANEIGIIKVLVQHGQQELARSVLIMNTVGVSAHDFEAAFSAKQYDLCVDMLNFKEARVVLDDRKMQAELIRLTEQGDTCLQAIEMLNRIPSKNWHMDLTKDLCATMSTFAKKSTEMIICSSPLLFCVLAAEFFTKLAGASLQHETRCIAVVDVYLSLGLQVESCLKDEQELRYSLMERDSRSYTVLTILSKNRFYSLLEHDEIGTIVTKMWIGARRNYGIVGASTIANSFNFPAGSEESMQFSRRMDKSKPYMFHYEQWTESCNNRFMGQAVCTIIHVILYQMVIYTAISDNSFMDVANSPNGVVYLRIAQVWVLAIAVEHALQILFGLRTGRGYEIDNWRVLDYIMFIITILIMSSLQTKLMGAGNPLSTWDPVLFNAVMHSIMMTIVWIRFMSVLITTRRLGPFLRMIYMILLETTNYFVIWGCFMICSSAVFTALFNSSQDNWGNFSISLRNLLSCYLGQFVMGMFSTENMVLGGLLLGLFLLLANVMFLNLLVAVLTNVCSDLSEQVDSEHRAVVISYHNRWVWHEKYGVLILLPPPLTLITAIIAPIMIIGQGSEWLNDVISKVFYIFYAIPQFMIFAFGSFCYVPLLYFKGFIIYGKSVRIRKPQKLSEPVPSEPSIIDQSAQPAIGQQIRAQRSQTAALFGTEAERAKLETFSVFRCFIWTFIGIPWLFWAFCRDCVDFWMEMYKSTYTGTEDTEKSRIDQLLTEKFLRDLQLVLKSISAKEVTVSQLVEMWTMVEQSNINVADIIADDDEFENSTAERKAAASEFFLQFANSSTEPIVNVERMRRMLPRKLGHVYNLEYLMTARHINVPWMSKAVKKYQQLVGSMTIGGVAIPRNMSQAGQNDIDKHSLASLNRSVTELMQKYNDFLTTSGGIRGEMEDQTRVLKALRTRLRKD